MLANFTVLAVHYDHNLRSIKSVKIGKMNRWQKYDRIQLFFVNLDAM